MLKTLEMRSPKKRKLIFVIMILTSISFCCLLSISSTSTTTEITELDLEEINTNNSFLKLVETSGMLSQSDPRLITVIKTSFLNPPSSLPYNLKASSTSKSKRGQIGQSKLIDEYLRGKENGFFIEAGAFDGEYLSNSLFFELKRNWNGLLVEANGNAFKNLTLKHRKSWSIHSCLSVHDYPEKVRFDSADVFGGIVKNKSNDEEDVMDKFRLTIDQKLRYYEDVQCFPIYSLLLALNNPTVDYFSLDVEGAELDVLLTIPWDKVDIKTLSVEVEHSDSKKIAQLMMKNHYKVYKRLATDIIFVKI